MDEHTVLGQFGSRVAGEHGSFDGLCADHLAGVLFVFGNDPDVENSALRI